MFVSPCPRKGILKTVLLGATAALAPLSQVRSSELPARKAAPAEYVRVCEAYGAGFFFVPGTDTCLRVGGLAMAEYRAFSVSYRMPPLLFAQPFSGVDHGGLGFLPTTLMYGNATAGSDTGFLALGRIELDARTPTSYGTLRTFLRLESQFGSETTAATGSLSGLGNFYSQFYNNNTASAPPARESTILNKAFIQFGGLTAGRTQSFFDFYVNQVNFEGLRGSNATVVALAYTQTFGDDWSATLSMEDNASRRDFIGSTVGSFDYWALAFGADPAAIKQYGGVPGGSRVPEIVGNLRFERPWGAVQVSGAAHQLRTSLFSKDALAVTPAAYAIPVATAQDYGFATQLGVQFNLDKALPEVFSPGDKLWLQASYEVGATGYIMGTNIAFEGGPVNANDFYGFGNGGAKAGNGWNFRAFDCIWTALGHCDKSRGFVGLAALKHYWTPTLSSGLFGSYMALRYSGAAKADVGGGIGAVDSDEYIVGSNLVWTPVKNLDIGAEAVYLRVNHLNRPVGLAPDSLLNSVGLPSWKARNGTVEGRLRLQRSF